MNDEHKRCPFCGSHPILKICMDEYWVSCLCGIDTKLQASETEAWAIWDGRIPSNGNTPGSGQMSTDEGRAFLETLVYPIKAALAAEKARADRLQEALSAIKTHAYESLHDDQIVAIREILYALEEDEPIPGQANLQLLSKANAMLLERLGVANNCLAAIETTAKGSIPYPVRTGAILGLIALKSKLP